MNFKEELKKVKQGIAQPATRQQFLEGWFSSEPGVVIGQNPTIRGIFAADAGLISEELRAWGNAKYPVPRLDQRCLRQIYPAQSEKLRRLLSMRATR